MPIRIPIIDSASVQSRGAPGAGDPFITRPNYDVAQAVGQAGHELGQVGNQIYARAAEAERQADALREADAMTQLQAGGNAQMRGQTAKDGTRAPGYLDTQGEEALASAAETLDTIKKQRDAIAEGMNDRQRANFMRRSESVLESFNNNIEHHSAQQFQVAKKATSEALAKETLKAIENDPTDLSLPIRIAQVERTARDLQLSPEDGDADVSRFKAAAATAQINGFLANGNIAAAKQVLEEKRDDLGVMRDEAAFKIERKENAGRIQREQTDNEIAVTGIMGKARRPDGRIDEGKALELLTDTPPERFTEVRRLFDARLQLEHRKDKFIDSERRKTAREQFIQRGGLTGIDPQVIADLEHYDGEFYTKLKREQDLQNRRARAGTKGKAEIHAADRLAIIEFQTLGQRSMAEEDTEEFAMGRGLSDEGKAKLKLLAKKAGDNVTKGRAHDLDGFVDDAEKLMGGFKGHGKKAAQYGAEDRATFRARATDAFQEFYDTHEGRKPNDEETLKITNELTKAVVTEKGFFRDTTKPAFLVPQPGVAPTQPQQQKPKAEGKIRVRLKANGKTGNVPAASFNAATMEKL